MKTSRLALGAVIGAGVGIVAGVLAAPKSGKETRDDLRQKSSELLDKAQSTKDDLLFKAEEIVDDVRDTTSKKIGDLKRKK